MSVSFPHWLRVLVAFLSHFDCLTRQAAAGADLDQSSQISSVVVDSLSPIEAERETRPKHLGDIL